MLKEKGLDLAWDYETVPAGEPSDLFHFVQAPGLPVVELFLSRWRKGSDPPTFWIGLKDLSRITETSELVMDEALEKRLISTPKVPLSTWWRISAGWWMGMRSMGCGWIATIGTTINPIGGI